MPDKPYIIRISSQKGGVGKTTIAVNLGVALANLSQSKVLIVDADSTNPSIGFQVGLDDVNIGYEEVVRNKVDIKKAIVPHSPSGTYVLPGAIHAKAFSPNPGAIAEFMRKLSALSYDFIIIDTAPGLTPLGPSQFIDEALIITTPEMSACTSSVRLAKIFSNIGVRHGLLVNRVKNRRYEISMREINELYGNLAQGPVPEDEDVPEGVAEHIPAYLLDKKSEFSRSMKNVGRMYLAKKGMTMQESGAGAPQYQGKRTTGGGLIGLIKRLIGLR